MKLELFRFRPAGSVLPVKFSVLVLLSGLLFASCDKDKVTDEEEPINTPLTYHKLQRVQNLPTSTSDASSPLDARPPVFYKLGADQTIDAKYAKTKRWDLAFGGMFNCYLSGNNGTNATNHGFMGPGTGGIMILEKAFDEVVDIPADEQFSTAVDVFGSDAAGNYGDRTGWFLYDFSGVIVSDGRPEKAHVAYALAQPLTLRSGAVVKPRTIVLRTASGDYAKIKMISAYKDLFTPEEWFINSPFVFFTFEYVLVPAGSKKFEIK